MASLGFGVLGGDDAQDLLELVQSKNETASKEKSNAEQSYMLDTLDHPDESMSEVHVLIFRLVIVDGCSCSVLESESILPVQFRHCIDWWPSLLGS